MRDLSFFYYLNKFGKHFQPMRSLGVLQGVMSICASLCLGNFRLAYASDAVAESGSTEGVANDKDFYVTALGREHPCTICQLVQCDSKEYYSLFGSFIYPRRSGNVRDTSRTEYHRMHLACAISCLLKASEGLATGLGVSNDVELTVPYLTLCCADGISQEVQRLLQQEDFTTIGDILGKWTQSLSVLIQRRVLRNDLKLTIYEFIKFINIAVVHGGMAKDIENVPDILLFAHNNAGPKILLLNVCGWILPLNPNRIVVTDTNWASMRGYTIPHRSSSRKKLVDCTMDERSMIFTRYEGELSEKSKIILACVLMSILDLSNLQKADTYKPLSGNIIKYVKWLNKNLIVKLLRKGIILLNAIRGDTLDQEYRKFMKDLIMEALGLIAAGDRIEETTPVLGAILKCATASIENRFSLSLEILGLSPEIGLSNFMAFMRYGLRNRNVRVFIERYMDCSIPGMFFAFDRIMIGEEKALSNATPEDISEIFMKYQFGDGEESNEMLACFLISARQASKLESTKSNSLYGPILNYIIYSRIDDIMGLLVEESISPEFLYTQCHEVFRDILCKHDTSWTKKCLYLYLRCACAITEDSQLSDSTHFYIRLMIPMIFCHLKQEKCSDPEGWRLKIKEVIVVLKEWEDKLDTVWGRDLIRAVCREYNYLAHKRERYQEYDKTIEVEPWAVFLTGQLTEVGKKFLVRLNSGMEEFYKP